ncbi:DNA polymerase alpha/epsilon subunit B-domain-containing protein [Phycomyces nitens]|nr:DNA polymerase alpha/epsilon subunit B-domain-containing protein [Phycomyces nitens]
MYANPTKPSQSEIVAVGRICCDSSGAKLNKTSIVLETSRELGMGKRVKLDLRGVEEYSLFPGQIVAVKGTNNTGKTFTVDSFLEPPLPPVHLRKDKGVVKYMDDDEDNQPIDIMVTSGPYTLDDDLSYKTLEAFIQTCIAQKPDVVILMGPFVPENHPIIASGELDVTPQDVFREQVAKRINDLEKASPSTQILLMPHADDLIHEYPLFPQPQFSKEGLGLGNVQTLSNPAFIAVNDTRFAIGNTDILFSMSKEEVSGTIPHKDRLGRLTRHILEQRSFYPLFPSAINDSIDSSQFPDLLISETPDFLILPSQLKQFTKKIDDTVAINPGYLSKRRAPGTYARILIHPVSKVNNDVDGQTKAWERTRIDLVRL